MTDDKEETNNVKNIKLFVRVLPLSEIYESCVRFGSEDKAIYVRCLQDMQGGRIARSKEPSYWRFSTDGLFYNASQEEVYEGVAKDLLSSVLDGANCVVVTYGQTGSGKSFTVGGLRNHWESRGLVTRLLSDMFEERKRRKNLSKVRYRLSYVEFYGNQIRNLLVPEDKQVKGSDYNPFKRVTSVAVRSEEEALKKLFEGEARREFENGKTYRVSHLGTGVITFHVANTSLITSWAAVSTSEIHIVEMAGFETVGKPNCFKTATNVGTANLAKSQLEQFFLHLGSIDRGLSTPVMRTSSLLKYLGKTLSISSMLRFIAHIRVTREDLEFTLSTLRFGSKVTKLKPTTMTFNVKPQATLVIQKLQEEVNSVKRELDINDMFFHQENLMNISKSRAEQIREDAVSFMKGRLCDLTLLSVSQAQILLRTFKELYDELEAEKIMAMKNAVAELHGNASKEKRLSIVAAGPKISKVVAAGSSISAVTRRGRKSIERHSVTNSSEDQVEQRVEQKFGNLDKSGITLGPGQSTAGNSTAIFTINVPKFGVVDTKMNTVVREEEPVDIVHSPIIIQAPAREEAFERFMSESEDARELKRISDEIDEALRAVQKIFTTMTGKHLQVKFQLLCVPADLIKQQNMRHLAREEIYDSEGRILIPDPERVLAKLVASLESALCNLQAEVIKAREELRSLIDRKLDAKNKLDAAFQAFCEIKYGQPLPEMDKGTMSLDGGVELKDHLDEMKNKFRSMQQMMTNMIEKRPVVKKRWNISTLISRKQSQ